MLINYFANQNNGIGWREREGSRRNRFPLLPIVMAVAIATIVFACFCVAARGFVPE